MSAAKLLAAVAAVAVVGLQIAGSLDLRWYATAVLIATAALLGSLAQRAQAAVGALHDHEEREQQIAEAVALWPVPRVHELAGRGYDVGVFPAADAGGGEPPAELGRRLREGAVVLIVGPPGAGKSSLALRALCDTLPHAVLIAPEGADGLATLLALDPPPQLEPGTDVVLLLDGLHRFLPGLHLALLDRLTARLSGLRVVATIRDDELASLLHASDEDGYVARRFAARAHLVAIPPRADTSRAEPDASLRRSRSPLLVPVQTDAVPDPLIGPPAPPRVRDDLGVRARALGILALLAAFAAIWATVGPQKPAPVAAQLTALRNAINPCGSQGVSDPGADAVSAAKPVVVIYRDAGGCGSTLQSDKVALFAPVAGRLTQLFAFQPNPPPHGRYVFTCLGTLRGDPCLTNVTGTSTYAVTGAFTNTETLASYPVEIERTNGEFALAPLREAAPHGRPAAATLTDGGSSVTVAPTAAFALVQPFANQPPVYVAGTLAHGLFDWPRQLRVSAWSPATRGGTTSFDRACRAPLDAGAVPVSFTRGSGDYAGDLAAQLAAYWRRLTRPAGDACP